MLSQRAAIVLSVVALGTALARVPLQGVGVGQSAESAPPTFTVDPAWPRIPNGWVLGDVSSIAVDSRDHIWVLQRPASIPEAQRAHAAPPVLEFDEQGRLASSWGGAAVGYEWPEREHGIYVDPKGFVWIGGNNGYGTPVPPGNSDDMLLKFTTAGTFVMQIGRRAQSRGNLDTTSVRQAADAFLVTDMNELFVADGYGNHRVVVFDADTGAFKRMWGAYGRAPSDTATPAGGAAPAAAERAPDFGLVHSIKVSRDGLVYVADRNHRRVQVFTTDGVFRTEVRVGEAEQGAAGLAFSPDAGQQWLYVADQGDGMVAILERRSLRKVGTIGTRGAEPGQFGTLHHLAADSLGNVFTAEIGRNRRAQKFVRENSGGKP